MLRLLFHGLLAVSVIGSTAGCQVQTGHRDLDGSIRLVDQWSAHLARCFLCGAVIGAGACAEVAVNSFEEEAKTPEADR